MNLVPANSLSAGFFSEQAELENAALRVLRSGWYILGTETECFEEEFAEWLGVPFAVGVANGTDALMLALRVSGVGVGDGVFTVSHTAVATVAAIEMLGATPLLVDVDRQTLTMCPDSLRSAVHCAAGYGIPLKAVVPVHLYGHPCDIKAIMEVAEHFGLQVIEDCSQSHGAEFAGRKTGSFGHLAAFSLYPTKNLGAFGDAGVIATGDSVLAEQLRMLRQYGWKERNNSEMPGVNSRLDELQAALLRVRLRSLDARTKRRQSIARQYEQQFGMLLQTPVIKPHCSHVFHQYVVRSGDRDGLQQRLREAGVATMIHYPKAVHQQTAYAGRLPVVSSLETTESEVPGILSLPMFPEMSDDMVQQVCSAVSACGSRVS